MCLLFQLLAFLSYIEMKRAATVIVNSTRPKARKGTDGIPLPNIWSREPPTTMHRSASALGELQTALQHDPETWYAQDAVHEAVIHDHLAVAQQSFERGKKHGEWLKQQEVNNAANRVSETMNLQSKLYEIELKFSVLTQQYDELKKRYAKLQQDPATVHG